MFCDHDCLRCVFEDCICPEDELTETEITDAERRDKAAWRQNCVADYQIAEVAARKQLSDDHREYYIMHRTALLEYGKRYRIEHREERRILNASYYAKNRDRINALRREKRRLKKKARKP